VTCGRGSCDLARRNSHKTLGSLAASHLRGAQRVSPWRGVDKRQGDVTSHTLADNQTHLAARQTKRLPHLQVARQTYISSPQFAARATNSHIQLSPWTLHTDLQPHTFQLLPSSPHPTSTRVVRKCYMGTLNLGCSVAPSRPGSL
jgi:hypothetical protein